MGCDKQNLLGEIAYQIFQSTHPRGVRLNLHRICFRIKTYFNPRTHVGCDKNCATTAIILFQFQSTHPRGVRPTGIYKDIFTVYISIHAPTWGATVSLFFINQTCQNFNPRTHVGCDFQAVNTFFATCDFNPRTHVGCDTKRKSLCQTWKISIHAPTWGATY